MKEKRLQRILVAFVALLVCLAGRSGAEEYRWDHRPGESVALERGETTVWQFHFGPEEPKPFFHPVGLPDGRVITWNRPPDHAWHHALWFAWKYLNGVNYWEPDPATGKPAGSTQWSGADVTTRPDGTATIAMDLTYRGPDGRAVLTEKRTVRTSAPGDDGSYHFDWTSTFTAGNREVKLDRTPLEGEPGGKAWGGYAGLSLRLAKELTERAADSTEGPVEFNDPSRYRGRAVALDYHGLINGRPIGVAVCDHPKNLNHPTPWYVIRAQPMSYFSPAVLCYGPHTLPAGEQFTLRYRVIVHPGRWDAERLRKEYEVFVEEAGE